jgi:hypothetical protein
MIKLWCAALVLGLLPGMPALLMADDSLLPVIPEAQRRFSETQGCVEPVEIMRRNHIEYILQQRDETMHKGIRTRQYSLVECINCHVSDAPDAARYGSAEHFCSSCHKYVSVQIDCFQCHADRPVKTSEHNTPASGTVRLHGKPVTGNDALPPDNHQAAASGDIGHE